MALKENNSNEEPTTGAVAIQIVLAMSTCLPTIAYRISHAYRIMMERLIKQPLPLWPHNGPTNPQSHCCDLRVSRREGPARAALMRTYEQGSRCWHQDLSLVGDDFLPGSSRTLVEWQLVPP